MKLVVVYTHAGDVVHEELKVNQMVEMRECVNVL